jgi:hypothetical protein
MMNGFPCRTRLFYIECFKPMSHGFFRQMELAIHPVAFIVGVSPQFGARWWREVLVAMTLTHHCLLPEPA